MSKAEAFAAILEAAQCKRGPPVHLSNVDSAEVQLVVSVVETVESFFGHQPSDIEKVAEVAAKLAEFCPTAPLEKDPKCNKVYAAVFSEDGRWYRCRILKKIDCTKSYVQYLDYGNCEEVNHEQGLVSIPNELSEIRPLAIFCVLDGLLGLRKDDDPATFNKALKAMQKLLSDRIVVVKTKTQFSVQTTNSLTSCWLLDTGLDIIEEVINQGYCKKKLATKTSVENVQELLAPSKPPHLKDFQARPNEGSDSTRDDSQGYFHGCGPGPVGWFRAPFCPQRPVLLPDPGAHRRAGLIPKLRMVPHAEYIAQSKRSEAEDNSAASMEQLRSEQNQLRAELQAKKAQIEALERQVASKGAVGQCFTSKLQGLISLLNEASIQRQKFSTDPDVKDIIEKALDEQSGCRQIVEPIRSVETAITHHQAAQEAIQNCLEKDQLAVLVAKRDAAFDGLLQELQALKEVSQEADRTLDVQHIKSVLDELKQVYGALLENSGGLSSDTDSITLSLNDFYQSLKQEKGPDLHMLRQETDTTRAILLADLQGLQQVLQGVRPDNSGKEFSLSHLDMCTDNLQHSVKAEVSACSLVLSDSHGPFAALLRRLVAALQGIIDQAANSSSVQNHYSSLFREMSVDQNLSWHNSQQQAREASQLLQDLRKLKSALRHRLADFEDVEQADEQVAAKVAADISTIRDRIHAAFIEEELLMAKLCHVYCRRFPELAVLHPELDLPLHQKYNGLLRPYWDLSAFFIQKSGSVLKTALANKDMIIAEYALDRPEDLHRLLAKANNYNLASSPHLVPIRAVFQSKDQRHAYLLVPDMGTPMAGLGRPIPHLVLRQVLSALSVLHGKTANKPPIPHGRIHPDWLLVSTSDRPLCLGLPDFQLGKGCQLPVVDGIDFTAPELRYSNAEPTPASDMFAFGCLMFWVLFHAAVENQSFPRSLGPVEQLQQRGREDLIIIRSLVKQKPEFRPSAAELLVNPFFESEVGQQDIASGATSFHMPT